MLRAAALALALAARAGGAAPRPPTAADWAARPPLGWNPCNGFQCRMSLLGEAALMSVADAIAANGMRAAGYALLALDDGWQGARDAAGALTADAGAFPSRSLAPLAAHAAARGLALGAYTDRGDLTCERRAGSRGHEAQDAATLAAWGVAYLKEDSCNASEVEADRRAEYGAMARAAAARGLFLSVCGWAPTYAAFGGLAPPVGGAWRVGPDAGEWARFVVGLEGAAAAARFAGAGRGWPDLDMLAGHGPAAQERARLAAVAVVGSPLLLSWDVRAGANASTLPLAFYLNAELLAIHQDAPPPGAPFYARVAGGAATRAAGAAPAVEGAPCGAPAARWARAAGARGDTLEAAGGAPGWCLAAWDLIPGGAFKNPINAYLLPCANATAAPAGAFEWVVDAAGATLSSAYAPPAPGLRTNPFPGAFLTASGVPGALFLQPRAPGAAAQAWRVAPAPGGGAGAVTLAAADGSCLAAAPPADDNVWARWLAGGDVALLLVNLRAPGSPPARVACAPACAAALARGRAPPRAWRVRDVFARTDNGTFAGAYESPPLEADGGAVLLRLTPVA